MKRVLNDMPFLLMFTCIDLTIFYILYVFHAFILKGFFLSSALLQGSYEIAWRIVSLQIFIQFLLLALMVTFKLGKNYLIIIILSMIAYSIASILSFSEIASVWKLMKVGRQAMGEGFAIFVSVTLTYLFFLSLGMLSAKSID